MKTFVTFLTALLFLISSCATAKKSGQGLDGDWQLSVFAAGDKTFAELFSQRRPQISFKVADGQVSGTTGCNRFFGPYTAEGNRLSFGSNLGVTKMACPGYEEQTFLEALNRVDNYKLAADRLELRSGDVLLMTFTRQ